MEKFETIKENLEKLLAIETLEYLDKNWLCGNDKHINEMKRNLIRETMHSLGEKS